MKKMSVCVIIYMISFSFSCFRMHCGWNIWIYVEWRFNNRTVIILKTLYNCRITQGQDVPSIAHLIFLIIFLLHLQLISRPSKKSQQESKHFKSPMIMLCRCKRNVHQKLSNLSFTTYPQSVYPKSKFQ